jgi:P-type conjugative transfer protein TrbJ
MRRLAPLPAAILASLAALALARPAQALVVFDPTNYAQNVLTAARALQQIQNQVSGLQNQAAMLLNQARNLSPLGLSMLPALQADMGRINALLADAGRIANDVGAIRAAFDHDYPADATGLSDQGLAAAATSRWLNSVEAFRHVLDVQATVVSTLQATQSQAGQIADASQGAAGGLQAAQAGNQLLAVQSKQLADLTAVMAAQARSQALEAARQAQTAADAKARLARFLAVAP